jgi:hypothetical protein
MRVRLTKLSDAKHRLALIRDDGACESIELASRSFLWHDFLYYAVETNAGLHQSFWGLLAGGRTLADWHDAMSEGAAKARASEAAVTEAGGGVLTDVVRERGAPGAAIAGLSRWFEAQNREVPAWLSADFVERVRDHMRRVDGGGAGRAVRRQDGARLSGGRSPWRCGQAAASKKPAPKVGAGLRAMKSSSLLT